VVAARHTSLLLFFFCNASLSQQNVAPTHLDNNEAATSSHSRWHVAGSRWQAAASNRHIMRQKGHETSQQQFSGSFFSTATAAKNNVPGHHNNTTQLS